MAVWSKRQKRAFPTDFVQQSEEPSAFGQFTHPDVRYAWRELAQCRGVSVQVWADCPVDWAAVRKRQFQPRLHRGGVHGCQPSARKGAMFRAERQTCGGTSVFEEQPTVIVVWLFHEPIPT